MSEGKINNTTIFSIVGLIIVIATVGGIILFRPTSESAETASNNQSSSEISSVNRQEPRTEILDESESVDTEFEDGLNTPTNPTNTPTNNLQATSYIEYSESALASNPTSLLFFKADWCPSCNALDADLKENLSNTPVGTQILDVDYDTQTELRKKYNVTTQHTLILVDSEGIEIDRWSGVADTNELAEIVTQALITY